MNLDQDTDAQFFTAFLNFVLDKDNSFGHLVKKMAGQQF